MVVFTNFLTGPVRVVPDIILSAIIISVFYLLTGMLWSFPRLLKKLTC